jgi:hypothetical protein
VPCNSGCSAGWDTPLFTVSLVLGHVTTPLICVPEALLHLVYVLNWHMLEASEVDLPLITADVLAANTVAKGCLR